MSDPLSIAAGIAGFLSLGIQVTQTLIDFYSVYKSQNTDIAIITRNMENLQSTFRSLETAIHQRQSQPNAEELLKEVDKATQNCHEIIHELQTECQKFRTESGASLKGRIQAAGRRATYPFRKSTIQKIEEDVSDIRENLVFALNVLQFKSHNRIENEISAVRSLLERTNSSQISFAIRAWLQAPDASINHNTVYAKHHPKTGLWFINSHQFANWRVERSSFLWLNGFAGCGKSVLCSAIIQHISRETKHISKVGIAFYYFAFSDESKQDANGMLRTLLLQLSVQLRDGERELDQLRILSQSSTPSKEVLLQTLRRFLERFQDGYVLLDALDECPRTNSREDVLGVIQAIRDWRLPSVHLLVTSQDQLDIRRSLNPSYNCDVSMKNPGTEHDIFDFVSHQLEHDTKLQRWRVRHNEIQTRLTQDGQGM
jgi:archaellum biogenesis ATPase FlaH